MGIYIFSGNTAIVSTDGPSRFQSGANKKKQIPTGGICQFILTFIGPFLPQSFGINSAQSHSMTDSTPYSNKSYYNVFFLKSQ